MPELPEVEVICRGLRQHLIGQRIVSIQSSGKKLRKHLPLPSMRREMVGNTIVGIERRAKYIQLLLDNGALLIIHLGMTGNLGIFSKSRPQVKHDHIFWSLENGKELRYHDVRRFGFLTMLSEEEVASREDTVFKTSGMEPFNDSFNGPYLYAKAKGREVMVKTFIMDSHIVVGIGNIYANESLFKAGIRPTRKIKRITKKEWAVLAEEIKKVLNHAIECGGSTISDFVNASQQRGYFQMNFKVYGKKDEECVQCKSLIKSLKITGRTSFFCPQCQK